MNYLEKYVYQAVKNNPRLKFFLRDTYQALCDFVPVSAEQSAYPIVVREGYFFGFHDKVPFSSDDSMLLAGEFDVPLRMPQPDDVLTVGYFTGPSFEDFNTVGHTRAWNWHQGCMLQWLGSERKIVYNDFTDGRLVCRINSVDSGGTRTVEAPVSSVSRDGKWGLSYSFPRVNQLMPGYGYVNGHDGSLSDPAPKDSGLIIVDMATGTQKFLFSVAEIADEMPESSMNDARHFLSHCQFSPSCKRFLFLHRWIHGNVRQRWSRLITSDLNGEDLHFFPTQGMVSHMAWEDDSHLLAYCRLARHGNHYVLFDDYNLDDYSIVGASDFDSDGHPSFGPASRWFVTDTYPDRFRLASLIIYDRIRQKRYTLARLKSCKKFATLSPHRHWSCDLHPRWNRSGTMLCFDSTHTGERSLCTMALGDDVNKECVRSIQ